MKRLLALFAIFALTVNCGNAAEENLSRDQLEAKKRSLEAELRHVNEQLKSQTLIEPPSVEANEKASYFIDGYGIYDVNSAGGVEVTMRVVNPNSKSEIKYLHVQIQLYDKVGEMLRSKIGGKGIATLQITGPIKYGDMPRRTQWDPVWYEHSGWCIRIISVQVQFLDNTKQSFAGKSLSNALKPALKNECVVSSPRIQM